jgi:hypothetical protein
METVSVLIGIFVGGGVASAIWIISKNIIAQKGKKILDERNSTMSSIGRIIAQIDTLVVSFSKGTVSNEHFKMEMTKNIQSIEKLYKPSLHLFEVFYVKYIDTLLNNYTGHLKDSTSNVQNVKSGPTHQFTDGVGVAEIPEILPKGNEAPAAAFVSTVLHVKETNTIPVKLEPEVTDEEEIGEIVLSKNTDSEKMDIVSNEIEFSVEPVSTERLEILPIEDADIPEFAPEVKDLTSESDDQQKEESAEIASASIPMEQEADMSFEEMAKDVMTVDEENDKQQIGFSSMAKQPEDAQVLPVKSVGTGHSGEEDFSMETIMDLDMSKIPGFHSEKPKITIKQQPQKPAENKIDVSEISFEPVAHPSSQADVKKVNPPFQSPTTPVGGTIKTPGVFAKQASDLPAKQPEVVSDSKAKANSDSPVNKHPVNGHHEQQADKDHYTITGDDVADQIDSFFGFNNK